MKNPVPSNGSQTIADILGEAHWPTLLPQLLRRARRYLRRLGWSESARERPSMLEAQELVNTAVESCLAGERAVKLDVIATGNGLVSFLSMTMRSLATNARTSAVVARRVWDDSLLDAQADGGPSALSVLEHRSLLARIEQALEGDDEALALHRALCEGHEGREKIANVLGWTAEHVTVVRWRSARRLASRGITFNEDEVEPPSSGPPERDRDHAHSADERRGAPREPDRRARRAGRRR